MTGRKDFAVTVLHHAVNRGDVIGQDNAGNVMVCLSFRPSQFDALCQWDADGDPDIEAVCEDEGEEVRELSEGDCRSAPTVPLHRTRNQASI
jgi:hypothetical protein